MIQVPVQDSVFIVTGAKSAGGLYCEPSFIEWIPVPSGTPARFYTETDMRDALNHPHPRVGWLIHAPPLAQANYDAAVELEGELDYILTSVKSYVERDPSKWLYYPHGGSHIPFSQWHDYPKTGLVSMLASSKDEAMGHKLRHEIKAKYGSRLDMFGGIVGAPYTPKLTAIAPYCYSVVVGAESNDWCLSDHLLDCLAMGTIPIFWGCPEVGRFFDADGIIQFERANDLPAVLDGISTTDYVQRLPAIHRNREIAKQYRVPEDWIYTHYPFLFEGL